MAWYWWLFQAFAVSIAAAGFYLATLRLCQYIGGNQRAVKRGPEWRIVTAFATLQGDCEFPLDLVRHMRSHGTSVKIFIDGKGKCLR